jgi:hypothetical protein
MNGVNLISIRTGGYMAFELYKKTRATTEAEEVSISSAGIITISPTLTDKHLKSIEYVELYFDSAARKVGIKPLKQKTRYSYQLLHPANSRRSAISGRGFLSSYKINQADQGKFKPQTFDAAFEDGMLIFRTK